MELVYRIPLITELAIGILVCKNIPKVQVRMGNMRKPGSRQGWISNLFHWQFYADGGHP